MTLIPPQLQAPEPQGKPMWWQALQKIYQQVARAFNGNIEFGNVVTGSANIKGAWAQVVSPGAINTDFTVTHNLGYKLSGYLVMAKSAACDVYSSPNQNTNQFATTTFIFRATSANVNLFLFMF